MPMKLPKVKQLRQLLYWMTERQRIYLKRRAGDPYPWTKDPIMQRFRFCNTYREQDKVTVWIRENWREPYALHPNLWFAMCIARQINWPATLAEIGFPEEWNVRKVLRILENRQARGEQIFSGAYILGGGNPGGVSKVHYTVMGILNPLWKKTRDGIKNGPPWEWYNKGVEREPCLQETFDWLLPFHGFGKFLTYEVVTDLRHTRYLLGANDIQTWANIGPGAQRGLNRLYERDLKKSHPQSELLNELLAVMAWIKCERDTEILPTIEPRDIEHALCEFDKYNRAKERLEAGSIIGLERFQRPGIL